jgi:hypothetical protein
MLRFTPDSAAPAPVEVSAGTGLTFSAGLGAAFAPDPD